jgi:hypothetical protein
LLAEIVIDVQEPLDERQMAMKDFFEHEGLILGIGYCNEVEYDDGRRPWYCDMDDGEGEDDDVAEYDDEFDYDDELEYDDNYYF